MNLIKVDSIQGHLDARRALAGLQRAGLALLDTYAPQRCIYCDQPSAAPEPLCAVCLAEFRANDEGCPRCALPFCRAALCPACQQGTSPLSRIVAPLVYDPAIAYLVKRWKYHKDRRLSDVAAKMMLNADIGIVNDYIMLPTPLHWTRSIHRGFNQSADLLASLCEREPRLLRWRCHGPALRRVRATAKQSLASRRERLANLRGAFRVDGSVQGRAVLLIDDVCTTGATAEAMAQALRDAGATRVCLWCLARTPAG